MSRVRPRVGLADRVSLTVLLLGLLALLGIGAADAAPLGAITEFGTPGANPAQVVAGPDGNLWFSDRNGAVGRITPDGTVSRFTSGLNAGSAVRSIALGADGNLWFSDPGTTRAIGVIDPTTQAISELSLSAGSMPLGIAAGPDGNIWFTDSGTTKAIGTINPTTHAISEFSAGLNPGSNLQQGLVAGPDGNLWFTDSGTTKAIGTINPTTHAISEFSAGLNPGSAPGASIVVGPDDALWFMDGGTTPAIGRIDPTTHAISEFSSGLSAGSSLGRITVAPDGNIWFANKGATPSVGVMNPVTHAVTEFTTGINAGSLPGGIWSGSDGNVWFTDQGPTRAIGRVGVGAPAASVDAPAVTGSGAVNVEQTCGGDVWSTWAGQQPSRSLFGFDGYRWLLDGAPITGANGSSYTPTSADVGHVLSCQATVTYQLLVVTASATGAAVQVKGAAEELDDLAAAVAAAGPGRSLAGKVAAIQDDVATNETANACATLHDFVDEVGAQMDKHIGAVDAASFISQAVSLEAALDC